MTRLALLLFAPVLLWAGPHGAGGPSVPPSPSPPQEADPDSTVLVLAASSLTDVLPRVVAPWEAATGVDAVLAFDATSRLAPQLDRGAPADLFVSADAAWMDWAEARGLVDSAARTPLVRNELVLAVPAGAPGPFPDAPDDVGGWTALERLALAGESVPAGRYARAALEALGVWDGVAPRVVRGGSVRGTLEWVARGEVDGGVVYRTDATAEPGVRAIFSLPVPGAGGVRYHAAVARGAPRPGAARSLLAHLGGPEAAALFEEAGFLAPVGGPTAGALPGGATPAPPPPVAGNGAPDPASAIRLSLVVALAAVVLGLVPAVGLGWLLARVHFPGKGAVTTLVLAPLVLPPVVTGFLLLGLLGRSSTLGGWLQSLGLPVPFTLLGAVTAALVVGLPLYVVAVRGAFEAVDHRLEELSWTLGTRPRATFLRVSLPLALPGIAAGAVLAFARALGEFGATIVLAGNVEGSTRTIALAVYTLLETPGGHRATWLLVGASVALSALALVGYEALNRRQRRRVQDR